MDSDFCCGCTVSGHFRSLEVLTFGRLNKQGLLLPALGLVILLLILTRFPLCFVPGSAVFKSLLPALMSSALYLVLYYTTDVQVYGPNYLGHPYPIGALCAALTFLLAFRANFGYLRWWESFQQVHWMHSKWLDVGMELAAFHLQSNRFLATRPPTFASLSRPDEVIERKRHRKDQLTLAELQEQLDEIEKIENNNKGRPKVFSLLRSKRNLSGSSSLRSSTDSNRRNKVRVVSGSITPVTQKESDKISPFLEEAAHLISLLSAVALSTLRNDIEGTDSPLITFTPGQPFPDVDPDDVAADVRQGWETHSHCWSVVKYFFGVSRTPESRTLYNAARPFRVIGGVSDAEIELLQAAHGPLAKVALCFMWLQEFMTREHLAGSTGNVGPPIISRLYQFTSDGMLGYNQARKIAYIPFPFPHAQITSLIVLAVAGFMPVLMLCYVDNPALAFMLNLLTVMSFTGLHEVARELENPFQNVPNDIPLNNFQGQFNEALLQMFRGFHPDSYWEVRVTSSGTQQAVAAGTEDSPRSDHEKKTDSK